MASTGPEEKEREEKIDPYIKQHCFHGEVTDEILGDPLEPSKTVMFRIEGQSTNHCYDLINWGTVISNDAEKKACIWHPVKSTSSTAMYAYEWPAKNRKAWLPVIKIPRVAVYAQTTRNLLTRFTTFYLKRAGKQSYGTPFGVSSLHAVDEPLYTAFPINRRALEEGFFKTDHDGLSYTFKPELRDVRNGILQPDTVVVVEANGGFSEINISTGEEYAHYSAYSTSPAEPISSDTSVAHSDADNRLIGPENRNSDVEERVGSIEEIASWISDELTNNDEITSNRSIARRDSCLLAIRTMQNLLDGVTENSILVGTTVIPLSANRIHTLEIRGRNGALLFEISKPETRPTEDEMTEFITNLTDYILSGTSHSPVLSFYFDSAESIPTRRDITMRSGTLNLVGNASSSGGVISVNVIFPIRT